VVVHCRAGIGRSSLIAGTVLVRFGIPPEEAWRLITAARGFRVPETPEQGEWLTAFAARGDTPAPDAE
jgi:protein-tyrosine phosphatase